MCTDYQSQNSNTVIDSFPLARIDKLFLCLCDSKVFLKLDLNNGYHYIPIVQEDCRKTAFNCRQGAFKFRVMQFGLKNAPDHFQQTMNQLFADMADACILVYLDDILNFNKNEEYKYHIHAVFKRLVEQGFHVKNKKCTLFTDSIEFLGYVVSAHGIEVCPNKIGAIRDWPIPTSIRDVQLFLGLCNYFRRLISKFAHVAQPLTDLTQKSIEFSWTSECQQAFEALKAKLLIGLVLTVFNSEAHSEVW